MTVVDEPEEAEPPVKIWDRIPPYTMLIIAVTGVIVSSAGAYWTLGFDVRTLDRWRIEHMDYHREKAVENGQQFGVVTEAIGQVRSQVEESRRRIDELAFRVGATEENARRTGEAIATLQASVNQQAGDIRVMREILERLDNRRADGGARRDNVPHP